MKSPPLEWPYDADGDVLRRLAEKDFDFTKFYTIDFNIDFEQWPPGDEVMDLIKDTYPNAQICGDEEDGYVLFQLHSMLTYDFIIQTQAKATSLVAKYGGRCESWGVLHKNK